MICLLRRTGILLAMLLLAGMAPLCAAVSITSIIPDAGSPLGGTSITISGTGFQAGATVTIGGAPATAVVVTVPQTISCTTPAGSLGSQPVIVLNPDTSNASSAFTYTAVPAPAVTAVAPIGGPLAGLTAITISGSGFLAGATVTIGGVAATSVSVVNAGSISCTTPAGAAGAAAVVVANPDTQLSNSSITYAYEPAPVISAVTPAIGPVAGGTSIAISGSSFLPGATVTIGGSPAGSVVVSATSISCTTPAVGAGSATVVVANPDTQSASGTFTYTTVPAPVISSVSPGIGPVAGGTPFAILGSNFQAGATVTIAGASIGGLVFAPSTIQCLSPPGSAGPALVVVTNPDTQSASSTFIYQGNGPSISAVSPALAPASGGTALTISGSGFLGSTVTIGGAPATAVVVVSPTMISCVSPAGTPGPANVVVTNSDLTSAQTGTVGDAFVYQGALPTITQINPIWGPVGTAITISGTNFQPGARVLIDRVVAYTVDVVDAQAVTCTIPSGVNGFVTVTVTNPDFTSAIEVDGFNVIGPSDLSAHRCGGSHGFSTLLLAPFIVWRLLATARRRRADGVPDGRSAACPPGSPP